MHLSISRFKRLIVKCQINKRKRYVILIRKKKFIFNLSNRAQVVLPEVDVTFSNVKVSAKAAVASRALPSIPNFFLNMAEVSLSEDG